MTDKATEPMQCECGKKAFLRITGCIYSRVYCPYCDRSGPTIKGKYGSRLAVVLWNEMMGSPWIPVGEGDKYGGKFERVLVTVEDKEGTTYETHGLYYPETGNWDLLPFAPKKAGYLLPFDPKSTGPLRVIAYRESVPYTPPKEKDSKS